MGSYAGVDYNLTLCPLQSRLQHIYHGQPYARVYFIPRVRISGFSLRILMTKICKKLLFRIVIFSPPWKDVQATWKIFQPSKENIEHLLIHFFVGHFCPPGSASGPSRQKSMLIWIHNTGFDAWFGASVPLPGKPGTTVGRFASYWIR
jgi:hypothetical protein